MGDPRDSLSQGALISPQATTLDKLFTRVPLSPSITICYRS